jgi:hypothetical protein
VGRARLLVTAAPLGSNPDISKKYKMGDINKGVAKNALALPKNIQKMYYIKHCFNSRPLDSTGSEDTGIEPRTLLQRCVVCHTLEPLC